MFIQTLALLITPTLSLQDNPNLEGNMQKIQAERGALETLLVNTAHELQVLKKVEDHQECEQMLTVA
jgi:hypothetical protein